MPRTLAAPRGHSYHFVKAALICSTLLSGAAASFGQAKAEDINWRQFEGASIVWAYDIHPYADAVAAQLPEFEKLTGIKVTPELYPDDAYWNKLTIQLSTKSPSWDVVTGIQPAWDLAPGQLLEPLDRYLNDPKLTSASYDYKDFFPALRDALTWQVNGGQIEPGQGQVWAIPHGFENIQLFYRKDILDKHGIKVPTTPPEMSAACEKLKSADPAITPLGVRGVRFWSSIHTAAISIAKSYGVHDFVVKDGKLETGLNSPESIAFHKDYVEMIKRCAAPSFANDNWYQVVDGINSGRTAMAIDSNMFGFWNDVAGKPASGEDCFRSATASSERQDFRIEHLDLVPGHECCFPEKGSGLALHSVGDVKAGRAERCHRRQARQLAARFDLERQGLARLCG
ncbi:extracellular solute-binding protein [Bradyrhizobium barranii subsp. barranii]|uniref:Extracellular solute-binding protein n=1 Tax=Bradyrhizobium barranii subsp. barranii TaxID=2823807 RepID=A0A9X9XV09_9BRAD|nr:extracellular solute-binding protein [Bradyrhizobium barranii]UEM11503.1 extracellular solute-binding protein [Bradyrhizobium barranii subsp. barranii]